MLRKVFLGITLVSLSLALSSQVAYSAAKGGSSLLQDASRFVKNGPGTITYTAEAQAAAEQAASTLGTAVKISETDMISLQRYAYLADVLGVTGAGSLMLLLKSVANKNNVNFQVLRSQFEKVNAGVRDVLKANGYVEEGNAVSGLVTFEEIKSTAPSDSLLNRYNCEAGVACVLQESNYEKLVNLALNITDMEASKEIIEALNSLLVDNPDILGGMTEEGSLFMMDTVSGNPVIYKDVPQRTIAKNMGFHFIKAPGQVDPVAASCARTGK